MFEESSNLKTPHKNMLYDDVSSLSPSVWDIVVGAPWPLGKLLSLPGRRPPRTEAARWRDRDRWSRDYVCLCLGRG